jgi:type I restriction enzyme S subunit
MNEPNQWPVRVLGDLFSIASTTVSPAAKPDLAYVHHSLPAFDSLGGPVVQLGKEIESHKFLVNRPCVLVSKLNPRIPRAQVVENPRDDGREIASTEFIQYVPIDGSTVDLCFYKMLFLAGQFARKLQDHATGTTGSHTRANPRETLRWYVVHPPLSEQRRIAEILDTLDVHINLADRVVQQEEAFAAALGRELIPVSPDPARLGDGWDLVELSEVVPSADYGISTPLAGGGGGTPTLRMNNLAGGRIKLHEVKLATVSIPEHLILKDGDVLFNRTNSIEHVGRASIWRNELPRATFASYLVRLNPEVGRLIPEYLIRWLNQPAIQQRIRRLATPGVHQVNINPTNLRRTMIELPMDISHQRRITEALYECERVTDLMKTELNGLRSFRQALMEGLLTGRVRVSEAESVLEDL